MSLDQLDRAQQLLEPLQGVVLALDGDEHLGRGHQGVQGEQAQRRRAVDDDVIQAGCVVAGDRPGQPGFPRHQRNQLDLRSRQVDGRRRAQQPRDAFHLPDDLGQWLIVDQDVVHRRGADAVVHVERGGRVPLRIEVDHQDAGSVQGQGGRDVDRRGGLADASLLVGDRHDPAGPGPGPGPSAAAPGLERGLGGPGNGRVGSAAGRAAGSRAGSLRPGGRPGAVGALAGLGRRWPGLPAGLCVPGLRRPWRFGTGHGPRPGPGRHAACR